MKQLYHASEAHIQMTPGRHIWLRKQSEAEWAVWFYCKCTSKYRVTFQLRLFACSLHSFNISDCARDESLSVLRLMFGIYAHPHSLLFCVHSETLCPPSSTCYSCLFVLFSLCLQARHLCITLSLDIQSMFSA